MITANCSSCGRRLKAPDAMHGEAANCPDCGAAVSFTRPFDEAALDAVLASDVGGDPAPDDLQGCPFCAEPILAAARRCKHCGGILDDQLREYERENSVTPPARTPPPRAWHPGVAGVLSLLIPGAGHVYKGQLLQGLSWFSAAAFGYLLLVFPGVVIHLAAIAFAMLGDTKKLG